MPGSATNRALGYHRAHQKNMLTKQSALTEKGAVVAARCLAAIRLRGNEIVRKLSDRAVIGDIPRSAAIKNHQRWYRRGRNQPSIYYSNQELVDVVIKATTSLGLAKIMACSIRFPAPSRELAVMRKS